MNDIHIQANPNGLPMPSKLSQEELWRYRHLLGFVRPAIEDFPALPEQCLHYGAQIAQIHAIVENLSAPLREIIELRVLEQLSYESIEQRVDISQIAARKRFHVASLLVSSALKRINTSLIQEGSGRE